MRRRARPFAIAAAISLSTVAPAAAQGLPPVPVPPENPITEPKRVLGKILFWEEQLSSDDSVACGTCHIPSTGGADPRPAVNPGPDGIFGNDDDVAGSLGVVRRDENNIAIDDPTFGFDPQVTGRAAQAYFASMYFDDLFWDGRASSTFVDPLDPGTTIISTGGGLESQAVGPIVSSVEMAHDDRQWSEVTAKLEDSTPLRLAYDIPADMQAALDVDPTYPDLFDSAFGDSAITPVRIAMAIATYERTLVADQTPWDLFIAGDTNAMNNQQVQGWNAFTSNVCDNCHVPPLFSDGDFHNIGLRPAAEDAARQDVTGLGDDFGDFKTPSLRNVGLRPNLMHNGEIVDVQDAIAFYREAGGHDHFTANQDTIPPLDEDYNDINIPQNERGPLRAFLSNALTDPRVENETFPFDRPGLNSELGPGAGRCDQLPRFVCKQPTVPEVSRIKMRNDADDARDQLVWKWSKGAETTAADYGDPTDHEGYSLCLYDGSGGDELIFEARAIGGSICGTKECWKSLGPDEAPKGYKYADSDQTPDGVKSVKLKAGEAGKAKTIVKARGANMAGSSPLGLPVFPLPLPLIVQLQNQTGECWEVVYSEALVNDSERFAAK